MKETARPVYNCNCGAGFVDAGKALKMLAEDVAPIIPGTPTIYGQTKVGAMLTANPGYWSPGQVLKSYQWLRNGGEPIPYQRLDQYVLAPEDANAVISVRVTGAKTYAASVPATSAPYCPHHACGYLLRSPEDHWPSLCRQCLESRRAALGGPAPVALAYEWKRNEDPIAGATGSQYSITETDIGATITVTVTGTKLGHTTVSLTSEATAAVLPADKAVTPAAVEFVDAPLTDQDTYTIPETEGVEYRVAGEVLRREPIQQQAGSRSRQRQRMVSCSKQVRLWSGRNASAPRPGLCASRCIALQGCADNSAVLPGDGMDG